ncbi:ferritin light chain [Halyomorpha halys]|uniref:ferritin light chain n=1 Tax=Halyomorpha halys TaxID=286706 RepID=UPI0006D4E6F4|nr:soma ferritin [Halyomorpha halys]
MRQLVLIGVLAFVVQLHAADDQCHYSVRQQCSTLPQKYTPCSALFSGAHTVMGALRDFTLQHILNSHHYLLMSANFANYERQRDGFAKMFKKLSDDTWEDAIDTIKYMTKRGGSMDFNIPLLEKVQNSTLKPIALELTEPESLSLALDMYKNLAHKAHEIHGMVTKRSHNKQDIHDAEVIAFVENKFVSKHTEIIRDLAGHSNDLMNLIKTSKKDSKLPNQAGLSIYLFDDYLKNLY